MIAKKWRRLRTSERAATSVQMRLWAMADAKEQRIADAKTLEDKEAAKGEADDAVQGGVDTKTSAMKELQGVL